MDAMEVVEAIKSIPKKKEDVREAFEALQSSLSSLMATSSSTLTLQWKWNWRDVEDHISSIETSVLGRFSAAIQQTTTIDNISTTAEAKEAATDDDDDDGDDDEKKKNSPKLELLKFLCINMDAKGLRSYLNDNYTNSSRSALSAAIGLALKSALDPALLILNAMDGFHPHRNPPICKARRARKREILATRKTCIRLLEILYPISLEFGIKPSVRERALSLAVEWKSRMAESKAKVYEGDNEGWETTLQAVGFLRLIAAYGLVPEFEADDVMELLCFSVSRKWMTADLVESLGLADKAHDLVQKLNSKGRQLFAIKIVYALNVSDKFPAVPLLKAYLTESRQKAVELRKMGNNSRQAHIVAIHKEIGRLMSVLKAIEQYKLESEFPRENIFKRIARLRKKLAALSVAASNSKTRQKQQSNKLPCPSPATSVPATRAPVIAAPYGLAATDEDDDDDGDDNEKKKKKNTPKLELLKFLCINMDAKGLRSCLNANRDYSSTNALFTTLGLALRSAPDPTLLILDAMDGFHPPRNPPIHKTRRERQRELLATLNLLEILYPISLEFGIKPSVRERALSLAVEWKARMAESKSKVYEADNESWETALQAVGFLRLITAYGLVPEFEADDVMEILCSCISRKRMTADLVESLGLADKVHDLVWKLNSKGRQLIAIDIVYVLNVSDKFPAAPLLKAYITESKQRADELRMKGNNSEQAQIVAIQKEMGSLKAALKVIERYKLESEYPRDNLFKMIALLHKKLAALSVATSNSKTQQKQQSNKRPRPSPATSVPATRAPVIAANSYHQPIQPHPQWGWAEGAPYLGVGPYGFVHNHSAPRFSSGLDVTGSVYNHGGPSLSCIAMDQGATHSYPRSYYSSESFAGTSNLYDSLVTFHGHHMDGLPSSYGSHLYP